MINKKTILFTLFLLLFFGARTCDAAEFSEKQRARATKQLKAALEQPGGTPNWPKNRLAIMRAIKKGADIETTSSIDIIGISSAALPSAARNKDLELVQLCLDHGACVDKVDAQSAIKSRPALELLIEHNYDVNQYQNNTDLPLNWAMWRDRKPAIAACLIEYGALPTLQEEGNGNTALQVLAREAHNYITDHIKQRDELEAKCRLILWHPHVTSADLKKRDPHHNQTLEEKAGNDTPGSRLFIQLLNERKEELEEPEARYQRFIEHAKTFNNSQEDTNLKTPQNYIDDIWSQDLMESLNG